MYTFDSSVENAEMTYNAVCESYFKLFELLGVEVIKGMIACQYLNMLFFLRILNTDLIGRFIVKGSSGDIGGDSSHEFHILSEVGEDKVLYCPKYVYTN